MNTNTIPGLTEFYRWNDALLGAPVGVLVFVVCIAVGYVAKWMPFVNNRFIPTIVVSVGVVLCPAISEYQPGQLRVAVVKNMAFGLVFACSAWLLHNKVLKRVEEKLGLFQDYDSGGKTGSETGQAKS